MLKNLKETMKNAPIVRRGTYNYFIHPISDGVPLVRPELLREVIACIVKNANLEVDKIVTVEAMGLPLGAALSTMTDIPFIIIRKRKYELPGEIAVHQATGYSKGELYLNGINKGDRVLIVDDVISTGGTMKAVIQALEQAGAIIEDIVVVIERGEGRKVIEDMGYRVQTIIKIDVDEHGVKILGCIDDKL
ncbi:Adenine/guanine phosphoribosyltransferase and related PRPP-binding protein [Methanocella conradii HZ254]|uniref:Hypoxanthine/guanine phosphoribosyltransferase n=1 Tax=Methanocella conradii (strain DSM 24694 / JCM 17849 / CGMCC 1.5162 / HZ254) TaxID=1041930 RepID=H8I8I6_METCZ|nr:hypoxanthine/guanine phosphoribosyltransferase [Methanocella conradii]AFC99462.1 Adenine/guanine phosphoribosyltransferase and related PRPP-binding protein [Methanocella conradii HZ254]MDI6897891.1 hypoxanthine/guanine phosphoribosyltransferase [Methanocella conradii]